MKEIRNIALFAHVDAGKTTVTEQMLYLSGAIKEPGRVDNGTASSDTLEVEKERGISVKSSCITIKRDSGYINIIDTPGHKDFSSETDRSLRIPDIAVLILSAVEGVQGNSERIWKNLAEAGIPVMVFINKLDRMGADYEAVLNKLQNEFSDIFLPLQKPEAVEVRNPALKSLLSDNFIDETALEKISENSDTLLEKYLEGVEPDYSEVRSELSSLIMKRDIVPVLYGTAISGGGVSELLEFIEEFIPASDGDCSEPLSGTVFKVEHRKDLGRTVYMKIKNGVLRSRDQIYNSSKDIHEKVTMLRKIYISKPEEVKEAHAGDIVMICGLKNTGVGDSVGNGVKGNCRSSAESSVIKVQVYPENSVDYAGLGEALEILADEDPALNLEWLKDEREFHINVMGRVQVEIIQGMLSNRFDIDVRLGDPEVIYREALGREVTCMEEYTMPKPCWAVVTFSLKPGNPGSGIVFRSEVSGDRIEPKYQQEIVRALESSLKQGPKGWGVIDLDITLTDGEHHNIHSRAGDFAIATPMALMKGLTEAGTVLMEPMLNFKIEVEDHLTGKVTGDIIQMRGEVFNTDINRGKAVITGKYPVAGSMNYPVKLGSISSGKGILTTQFAGYQMCEDELGQIREYRGVNPLDRSKFILQARKAI